MLVLGMTLTFQTKTEAKEIGVKTHAGQCHRMEEGTRHTNPMGLMHVIGRDSPFLHSICHKGISVQLKP